VDQASLYNDGSWVGMGWSLDAGSITVDDHGGDQSNNSWLLNVGGVSTRIIRDPDGYFHAVDENFWKIECVDNNWRVWDKQGNIYTFWMEASYIGSDGSSNIYAWYLDNMQISTARPLVTPTSRRRRPFTITQRCDGHLSG